MKTTTYESPRGALKRRGRAFQTVTCGLELGGGVVLAPA